MEFYRLPGELLDIGVQLHDGLDSFPNRVFYQIRNEAGIIVGETVELPHVGGGYFKEEEAIMPTNRQITVHLITRKDNNTEGSVFEDLEDSQHHGILRHIYRRIDASNGFGEIVLNRLDRRLSEIAFPLVDFEGEVTKEASLEGEVIENETIEGEIIEGGDYGL